MGLIICDKHGEQGIVINIEDDICRKILADTPLTNEELCVIKAVFYDDDETFLMDVNYLVSIQTKESLNLMEYFEIRTEEEDEKFLGKMSSKMGAVCGQCLNEYKFRKDIDKSLRKLWTYMPD